VDKLYQVRMTEPLNHSIQGVVVVGHFIVRWFLENPN
jgi:hypothetical protein